jgi:hypothetical protein
MSQEHIIPPITDQLGKHWKQPDRYSVLIDDDVAMMSQASFDQLIEYSTSIPSGVYDVKIWKRRVTRSKWLLCWYGPAPNPNQCSINTREIVIV